MKSQTRSSDWLDPYRSVPMRDVCDRLGIPVNASGFILCQNHTERTASCRVYEDHLHCYSCGFHADTIGLVQHVRGCDFWGAVEWIAHECGLPEPRRDPEAQARHEQVQSVAAIYASVWHDALKNPEPALKYLEGRGISRDATSGLVGYLPSNYRPPDLDAARRAGLYSQQGNFLFGGRLVIPVLHHGQIVSVYGRALDTDRKPTHVYPGTTDPPMLQALWNLDSCRGEREIVLVESIIDGLTFIDRGITNVVAAFGTSGMTDARVALLKQSKIERVTLVFDTDANDAGHEGAVRAGEKLFRAGYEVQIVTLPLDDGADKSDPNSYFQDHTADDFRGLPRRQFFDVATEPLLKAETIGDKKRAALTLVKIVADLNDPLLDSHYLKQIHQATPDFKLSELEKRLRELRRESTNHLPTGSAFLPDAYADHFLATSWMIHVGGEFHIYRHGVYQPIPEPEIKRLIQKFGRGLLKRNQIEDVIHSLVVKTFIRPDQVNDPRFLNLRNTLLNIETGEEIPHSPEILTTIQTDLEFDTAATCLNWTKFLETILPDPKGRLLAQEYCGYCLTSHTKYQKALICLGAGSNGKNVFVDTIEKIVGTDNVSAVEISDLKDKFRYTELHHSHVNLANEVEANTLINDAKLKKAITGDLMIGERKNKDPFKFRSFAKWIIVCNELPVTKDKSRGYFRRFVILEFPVTFSETDADREVADRLTAELPGILNWALLGYRRLVEQGYFTLPESSKAALDDYRRDIDPTLDFIDECLTRLPMGINGGVYLKDIYKLYAPWITDRGREKPSDRTLKKAIERNMEIKAVRRDGKTYFAGLDLRELLPTM